MVARVIQGNYDCLQEMKKLFMRHADLTVALTFQIEGLVDQLQGGGWQVMGAEAFYAEMRDLILPAMRKLEDALQFAGEGTGKIHHILCEAEEEAAALFRGLPGGAVTPPHQDDDERQKQLIHMLMETLRLSGLSNSPLPVNLESMSPAQLQALLDSDENAERSYVALKKMVLWALSDQQTSTLQDAFWQLDAAQRYELLTALTWLMEKLAHGEMPDTALLDNLSEPVRALVVTVLLNVIQRHQQAQSSEEVDLDIRVKHLTSQYDGAVFADWLGNVTAFLNVGAVSLFATSRTGGRRPQGRLSLEEIDTWRKRYSMPQDRLDHTDIHAKEWYGTGNYDEDAWKSLIEQATKSNEVIYWSSGGDLTIGHLYYDGNKYLLAQYYAGGERIGQLATVIRPNNNQLEAIFRLLKGNP